MFLLTKLFVAGFVFRSDASVLWFGILFTIFCRNMGEKVGTLVSIWHKPIWPMMNKVVLEDMQY